MYHYKKITCVRRALKRVAAVSMSSSESEDNGAVAGRFEITLVKIVEGEPAVVKLV
jgi:hypothetical protein